MHIYSLQLANALSYLGTALCFMNNGSKAAVAYEKALDLYIQMFGQNYAYRGVALTGLSVSHYLVGEFHKSREFADRAVKVFAEFPGVFYYRRK